MKIVTWNVNKANKDRQVWKYLMDLQPDIVLLQEVGSLPDKLSGFSVKSMKAVTKTGSPQKFSTVVLVKGEKTLVKEITLLSEYKWVNTVLDYFKGNFVCYSAQANNHEPINLISVYSPAWTVPIKYLAGNAISQIILKSKQEKQEIWPTEILWSALKNTIADKETWVVGGDFNSSETFDKEWQDKNGVRYGSSSGNREILDRMTGLGLSECLREYNGKITPTFKNTHDNQVIHQIDHLFVTKKLFSRLHRCQTGEPSEILDKSLSDHLPIIAEFD